jgi:pimeloyl-ACP methyl ester carboxylesterase/DNA-binding PadR family transcriptional regulator
MRWSPIMGTSRRTRPMRRPADGIAVLAPKMLGGVEQWVLVRGPRADAPILLKVHGGPGQAEIPTIHMNARLEEHFLVVEWDQRGAGKSAAAAEPRAAMTLDQIVADTIELTERLAGEYGPRQVILLGHSWGSLVGALAVHRRPDLFSAFVSTGQIAAFADGQRIAHDFVVAEAQRRGHKSAITAMASIPPPPYLGAEGLASWMQCVRWLGEFGALWHQPEKFRPIRWMLSSPEYSWPEKLRFTNAATRSFQLLYDDLVRADLSASCPELAVPVFMAAGRHDRAASARSSRAVLQCAQRTAERVGVVRGVGPLSPVGRSRRVRPVPHRVGPADHHHMTALAETRHRSCAPERPPTRASHKTGSCQFVLRTCRVRNTMRKQFFMPGELPLVLLGLLSERSQSGYELLGELERRFAPNYRPSPGSVYPALTALRAERLIRQVSAHGTATYRVTANGHRLLESQRAVLQRIEDRTSTVLDSDASLQAALARFTARVSKLSGRVDRAAVEHVLNTAAKTISDLEVGNGK